MAIRDTTPHRSSQLQTRELIYELHLPDPTPSNNAIKGIHFHAYKKLRNGWRASVLAAIGDKVPAAPITRSALEIERYCAGSLDWDNVKPFSSERAASTSEACWPERNLRLAATTDASGSERTDSKKRETAWLGNGDCDIVDERGYVSVCRTRKGKYVLTSAECSGIALKGSE